MLRVGTVKRQMNTFEYPLRQRKVRLEQDRAARNYLDMSGAIKGSPVALSSFGITMRRKKRKKSI